ncbi:MAG TPA: hypothetical protein VFP37_08450 [Steroidobacteraceae bacterium]|nr:hypothetical protein [Steroidobacteraceae bacterium]
MAGNLHPSDWRNASPSTKRLALLALLGVLSGIFLVNHFSARAARTRGPTMLARNDAGEILLANGRTLFLVDAGETRTLSLPVAQLGLRGPVLSVASDGKDWYLGDDATGMLHRCDLRARHCVAALRSQPEARIFRRAHHVAFAGDRIFLTDSAAHRVFEYDRDGNELRSTRTSPLRLCFPNGIIALDDGLYVADTNNFRIARLDLANPEHATTVLRTHVGAPLERANCNSRSGALAKRGSPVLNTLLDSSNTVPREARPPARPDRVWPASLLRTSSGEWWLIQMANRMRMGDVIRYDADGRPLGRVELPPEADPIELIEAHGAVLITDAGLTRVHRVTLDGHLSGEWGPQDFRVLLGAIGAERREQRALVYVSYAVIGVGSLAALFVVVIELRRRRREDWARHGTLRPVAIKPAALGHEPVWIPLDPEFQLRVRRASLILGALMLVPAVYFLYMASEVRLDTTVGKLHAIKIATFLVMLLVAGVFWAMGVSRLARRRIGVTRSEVRYDPGTGDLKTSRWEDVRVSSNGILVGRHLLQVIDPRGRFLYPQAQVEAQILSRLQPDAFVSNPRILWETLRRGNVALWFTAISFALYVAILVLKSSRPDLLQRMGAQFIDWLR